MHMIVYMSDYVGTDDTVNHDLKKIEQESILNNSRLCVTGVLFYLDGKFLQVLEGEENVLNKLMDDISNDVRHENVEILINTQIESRGFNDWIMDSFNLSNPESVDKEKIRTLTKSFEENLVPRSDVLVYYYKTLLELDKVA